MIQRIARGLWALWSIHTYSFVINIVSMKSKFTLFSFLMHIPSNIAFDHSSVYNILNKVILSKCNVKSSACEIASLMSDSCSFNHLQYCSSILIYNWHLFLKFKSHPTFFFSYWISTFTPKYYMSDFRLFRYWHKSALAIGYIDQRLKKNKNTFW